MESQIGQHRKAMPSVWLRGALKVHKVVDGSTSYQFRGSELYRRDIALHGPRADEIFSKRQIRAWAKLANSLNGLGRGDQAGFFLTVIDT